MMLVVYHQVCVIIPNGPKTTYTFDMNNHKIQVLKSHQSKLRADLEDVKDQIQQLAAEQEVIELQMVAIGKHLGHMDISSETLTVQGVTDTPLPLKVNGGLSLKGMPFREAVRTIISKSGRGLRPKEITSELEDSDFEYTGAVDIYLRVGNELANLKKAGKIRGRKGLYRLAQEGG